MRVPKENILGQIGRGLQAALTVLNYGRVTFGATCTGHAKACIKAMTEHAKRRVQFQQPLAEFQLVQKKIAFAAAHCFAMEAASWCRPARGVGARQRRAARTKKAPQHG